MSKAVKSPRTAMPVKEEEGKPAARVQNRRGPRGEGRGRRRGMGFRVGLPHCAQPHHDGG